MQKTMDEQTKVIQSLVEQIKKQQEYIEERDKRLILGIKENEESIKQVATANHEEKNHLLINRRNGMNL
jgi:polyhydroxyalkanoate synthesis regulator phasin